MDYPEHWARSSIAEDPARSLAVHLKKANSQTSSSFYCHSDQARAPHRANSFADWFDGFKNLETAQKPRSRFSSRDISYSPIHVAWQLGLQVTHGATKFISSAQMTFSFKVTNMGIDIAILIPSIVMMKRVQTKAMKRAGVMRMFLLALL